jgi:glutamine synthetase
MVATMVCGYLGLMEKKMPRPEVTGNAYINADELPTTLGDALDLFSECEPVQEVLTREFCELYEAVKRNEYKEFLQVISPWEREHLLLNV